MTLQRRLTLFFILIVIAPLLAAGFVVQRVVVGEVSRRSDLALTPALNTAVLRYNDRSENIGLLVQSAVQGSARFSELLAGENDSNGGSTPASPEEIDAFLRREVNSTPGLDFLVALDSDDNILGSALSDGDFAPGFTQPGRAAILEDPAGPGYTRTGRIAVNVGDRTVGAVVGGFWVDAGLLQGSQQTDVDTMVIADGLVTASTGDLEEPTRVDLPEGNEGDMRVSEEGRAQVQPLAGGMTVAAWTPDALAADVSGQVVRSMLALLAIAVLATAVLALLLARLITRPLEELTEGARAIARGRFEHRIPVRSRDEVGQLAHSFNEMSDQLEATITDLEESRDSLKRAVQRVGETLRSTHDMGQILESILNTATDAVAADAAALWGMNTTRDELNPMLSTGVPRDMLGRVPVGQGIVGLVAERGIRVLLPSREGGPKRGRTDPDFPVVIAIPLYSSDRISGVIALYRRDLKRPFSRGDLDTVVFLAEQGGVALENVELHEEAQRLSLTDGLTGVWNRRYLQMQFRQAIATAARFERPFSILMLDLDKFKDVNDSHGHQRGDSILVEFARRVGSNLREIDVFARYGGEEFVCLLAETDLHGAEVTAEKVRATIESEPFTAMGEEPVSMTVSIGIAAYPIHGSNYRTLLEAADQALYRAKQAGRNAVRVAEPPKPGLHLAR